VAAVYEALVKRHPQSRKRGRPGTPAEVVLRLLVLKHMRNWSYGVLEREVRANLVYRDFTRVGGAKMPDAKTMGRWGIGTGAGGGRADPPADRGDRARPPGGGRPPHARRHHRGRDQHSLSHRQQLVGRRGAGADPHEEENRCDCRHSRRQTARPQPQRQTAGLEIGRAARAKGQPHRERVAQAYQRLLGATGRVVGQAKRFAKEIDDGVKQAEGSRQAVLRVASRAGEHGAAGTAGHPPNQGPRLCRRHHAEGKIVSLFEPTTEVIRKGKAGKPTEFGKMVKLQEAENQIVIAYEVYDQRPSDSDILMAAIETHQARLGRAPHLVAADAGFYSAKNEAAAKTKDVKRVCIPNRSTKSPQRKREQKKRWFRQGQKWRTGSEGRISVVKRRHGLNHSQYAGDGGIKRWVGLGVIADNLVNISRAMAQQPGP